MSAYPRITEIPTTGDLVFYIDDECADASDSVSDLIDWHDGREIEIEVGTIIYVADKDHASASQLMMDADDVVNFLYDRGCDNGPEDTDGWPNVSDEGKAELTALLDAWAERHLPPPNWWTAENVREYVITQADMEAWATPAAKPSPASAQGATGGEA